MLSIHKARETLQVFSVSMALVLALLVGQTGASFDCTKGCSLEGPAACDSSGVLYANECIAVCQVCNVDDLFYMLSLVVSKRMSLYHHVEVDQVMMQDTN